MTVLFCADDIGLSRAQIRSAREYAEKGMLDSAGILGNSTLLNESVRALKGHCLLSLHLNLTEGSCCAPPEQIPLLARPNGVFYSCFSRLLLLSVFRKKELERQVRIECRAQLERFLSLQEDGWRIRIDSHRHFHMIPAVLSGMCLALADSGRHVDHIRFSRERLSLYSRSGTGRIPLANLVKVLVLNRCSRTDIKILDRFGFRKYCTDFAGVALSGHMVYENVSPLIAEAERRARRKDRVLEILFHPFGLMPGDSCEGLKPCLYESFYRSPLRKEECRALEKLRSGR